MEYTEIEQKYQLTDPDKLRAALTELGGTVSEPVRQVDTYYNAPHRDFLATPVITDWLRIRRADDGASFNFKKWYLGPDGKATHCDEYETPVADAEAVRRTLHALDFSQMIEVDKTREEWTIPGAPVLVAIDTLAGFGSFTEFEFKGQAASVDEAIGQLTDFIDDLHVELGDRIHKGYPHMMLGRDT